MAATFQVLIISFLLTLLIYLLRLLSPPPNFLPFYIVSNDAWNGPWLGLEFSRSIS